MTWTQTPGVHRIGVVIFDGVRLLEVAGPMEVFAEARRVGGPAYALVTLSVTGGPVVSSTGLQIGADGLLDADEPALRTLLVAGGDRLPACPIETELIEAVRRRAGEAPRVCSVCTGAFVLAAAGVLDGRRATTHWRYAPLLAARDSGITVVPDALWVRDGHVFTSAGVSAGIDLALALVEADAGEEVARRVARSLVVFLRRSGGQSQFSPPGETARPRSPLLRVVTDAVAADPAEDHSTVTMAAAAAVSPRHLSRLFRAELGLSPARYVEAVRIEAGRRCLEQGMSVADAAIAAGFGYPESMRRAFVTRLGVSPRTYQERFRSSVG